MKSFIGMMLAAVVSSLFAIQDAHAEERTMNKLQITSPAFPHNGMIPSKFTCDGVNVSPPLSIANIPEKTRSLALIVDDPDAPRGTWVHWVARNIAAGPKEIPENSVSPEAFHGTNDFGKQGYGGGLVRLLGHIAIFSNCTHSMPLFP